MARPPKAGLDYFPHDTDAVNDSKIQALMALHGPVGYAFYFIILERIFRTENGRITIGKLAEKAGLSKTIGITIKVFDAILETALEVGCFILEENQLSSSGVQRRLSSVLELREKERKRKEEYKIKKEKEIESKKEIENPTRKTPGKLPENSFSPEVMRLSGLLADLIQGNNPGNRELQPPKKVMTVYRWADDIDKLNRIDEQSFEKIEKVIRWCQSDPFWITNILSGAKLRQKWDKLTTKMLNLGGNNGRNSSSTGTITKAQSGSEDKTGKYAGIGKKLSIE